MAVIIFDFDGTIGDSLGLVVDIFGEISGVQHKLTSEEFEGLRKLPAQKIMKELGISFWRAPLLVRKGRKAMHGRLDEITVFEDLPEVLEVLRSRGYGMQIVTSNSVDNVSVFLERHALKDYFTDIQGDIGLFGKSKVLKRIAKGGKDMYYVGDEARDIVAAKKAGLRIVSVTWGYNHEELLEKMQPYALARKPQDLLELFPEVQ